MNFIIGTLFMLLLHVLIASPGAVLLELCGFYVYRNLYGTLYVTLMNILVL